MTFAWQGFSLDHPSDWGPASLTGTRAQGYIRLESPETAMIQVRWNSGSVVNSAGVRTYLSRLRGDAKKAGHGFESDVFEEDGAVLYSFKTESFGFGSLFQHVGDSRSYFVEAVGPSRKSAKSQWQRAFDSFQAATEGPTRWALLGLDVRLPSKALLQSKELKAGKTRLEFSARGAKVVAERWGFAEQLLAKQPLSTWLGKACRLPNATFVEEEGRVEASQGRGFLPPISGLARQNLAANQIEVILVESRMSQWRPSWDWFSS